MDALELPDVKRYHLIIVPVEGAHGGYVRIEDYKNLEIQAQVRDLRLSTALGEVKRLEDQVLRLQAEVEAWVEDVDYLREQRRLGRIWGRFAFFSIPVGYVIGFLLAGAK
jgi:uncharacterized membrane-anchored protein